MGNNIRIGKLFGIEVGLDYSWFIIFLLIVWSLAGHYLMVYQEWSFPFRLGLALVTASFFFASILAHEFGHSLVAMARGVPVKRITLFIFGGIAQIEREPKQALDEFLIALAGPIVSLFLAGVFGLVGLAGRLLEVRSLAALGGWLATINLSLALFNLIPGFPLDGGRLLRAIVWRLTGNVQWATRLVASLGQIVAWLFMMVGAWQIFGGNWVNGLWLAFIGWFLNNVASSSARQAILQGLLQGHTAREIMSTDWPRVSPDLNLAQLVHQAMLPSGRRCFPVVDGERLLGLVAADHIKEVPPADWLTTRVGQVMIPAGQLLNVQPDEGLYTLLERMATEDVNQLPVMDGERWLGIVARDNILNFTRARAKLLT